MQFTEIGEVTTTKNVYHSKDTKATRYIAKRARYNREQQTFYK